MDKKEELRKREVLKMAEVVEPDHELLLWEEWVKVRLEETTNLSLIMKRPPADLTMNLLEAVREDKERKIVLEHAQIDRKPSLRGGLWEQPQRLKQSCICQPVYEIQRTAAEMGTPFIIEHIGVPQYIEETEKGLSGIPQRKPCVQLDADYENYRDKRENEMNKKIRKINPFRPDISGLMVRGGKPKPPPKKLPPLPNITFTECLSNPEVTSVYAVRINNTVIYKDIPDQKLLNIYAMKKESWQEDCSTWSYYFNVPFKRAGRSTLYLENLGTVTLRYCWKKVKKNIPFIPEEVYEQVFFFNKNEDVLSPGQSKVLHFTFISDKPGIYSESWELSFCNICFFETIADKFVVNLIADSVEDIDSTKRKIEILKDKIDTKAIYNIASYLLEDIFAKATSVEPQIYPYKNLFLEEEMFLLRNPVCYYHQTEVTKMKDLYTEMAPGQVWNLSIKSWREKMMEKEFDDRMKYYELLRISHSELLKPWDERENVMHQKYRAMKWMLGMMADKFDSEYDRLLDSSGVRRRVSEQGRRISTFDLSPTKIGAMRNLFYLYSYENVATTIEMCAGILSSIDLNRWIKFDFCRV